MRWQYSAIFKHKKMLPHSVMNMVNLFVALGSNESLVASPVFHYYFSMTQPDVTTRQEEQD